MKSPDVELVRTVMSPFQEHHSEEARKVAVTEISPSMVSEGLVLCHQALHNCLAWVQMRPRAAGPECANPAL